MFFIGSGGQFHDDAFKAFVGHSSDGRSLTIADLAAAVRDQLKRDHNFAGFAKV
jgi:hypothetical protein